jgi:hypothetical protein
MQRTQVSSSNLMSIGYDVDSKILEIEFLSRDIYQYFDIPKNIFQGLMNAASHGTYLDANIKKAGYRYRKIN